MQLRKPATAILALALSAGLAQADDAAPAAGSTLDKIANNGVIVVGHRESSVPFSYYDNQQKVVGYSQDYSNAIVDPAFLIISGLSFNTVSEIRPCNVNL
ncbi:hypothetical protein PZH30_22755, partial [Escherichia coli]|nr:hypothetical protein [Escherichia coli]